MNLQFFFLFFFKCEEMPGKKLRISFTKKDRVPKRIVYEKNFEDQTWLGLGKKGPVGQ